MGEILTHPPPFFCFFYSSSVVNSNEVGEHNPPTSFFVSRMKTTITIIVTVLALCGLCALSLASIPFASYAGQVGGGQVTGDLRDCETRGQIIPDTPFRGWPTNVGPITATFCDPAYTAQFGRTHWGIDIGLPQGTPVYATAQANVLEAGFHSEMGNYIKLETGGWVATYMHLHTIDVMTGDVVTKGQQIGTINSTGFSTGDHLHYQLHRPDGSKIDPLPTFDL